MTTKTQDKYRLSFYDGRPALYSERGLVCVFEAGYAQTREQDASLVLEVLNEREQLRADKAELLAALQSVLDSVPFLSYRGDGELEECEHRVRAALRKATLG